MADKGKRIAFTWLGISLFTFAWSASDPAHTKCNSTIYYLCTPRSDAAIMGLIAGIAWPFYWAWTGAEALREASNHD